VKASADYPIRIDGVEPLLYCAAALLLASAATLAAPEDGPIQPFDREEVA
jgi:hypothetical protein